MQNEPPTIVGPEQADLAEAQALAFGKWCNLFMCVAGVCAAYLSRSDALLVDGLYSGVNFLSAIVAAQVSLYVQKPADHRYPFGYEAYEALYVTFRSLMLIGILIFATFSSGQKIVTYATGGTVPELILGPIVVYSALMVAICMFVSWRYHKAWVAGGRQSELLQIEKRSALVDGMMSAAAGLVLALSPLLINTAIGGLVPVMDAIVVLVLVVAMIAQPIGMFKKAFLEVAGTSAPSETQAFAADMVSEILTAFPVRLVDMAVTKMGRTHFVVIYIAPETPITGHDIDRIRDQLIRALTEQNNMVRCEVIATEKPPFQKQGTI